MFYPAALRIILVTVGLAMAIALGNWVHLFNQPLTPNALGRLLLAENRSEDAAYIFQHPGWQGAALYHAGRYNRAIAAFAADQSPVALYNTGNAYAQIGRYEEAIKVFEAVLIDNPEHEDARHNLDIERRAAELASRDKDSTSNNGANPNPENSEELTSSNEPKSDDIIQTVRDQPADTSGAKPDQNRDGGGDTNDTSSGTADSQEPGAESGVPGTEQRDPSEAQTATSLANRDEAEADPTSQALTQQRPGEEQSEESDIAEEILLRHIKDQPHVVLRARLYMAHKRETESN